MADFINGARAAAPDWAGKRFGLSRIRQLLAALGDPQEQLRFVHITGTNGKGSTAAYLDAALRRMGYRTGLYTSPHLVRFGERIRVNGEELSEADAASLFAQVDEASQGMDDRPTEFERYTAAGLLWFARQRCDIVVLEVGMGGEFDATNAVANTEVAVFTNIGLDHTQYLGATLPEIAATKAGILKPGCDAVAYGQTPEVLAVLRERAAALGCPFAVPDFSAIEPLAQSFEGQSFRYLGKNYTVPLLGAHQMKNAVTALAALERLRARGWAIPDAAAAQGLAETVWPARFELVGRAPLFFIDGGHNPQCAEALAASLRAYLSGREIVVLCGVFADKDYPAAFRQLLPLVRRFVAVAPDSPRALPAEQLAAFLQSEGGAAKACGSAAEGVALARALCPPGGAVVCFGSLYLAGEVRELLLQK